MGGPVRRLLPCVLWLALLGGQGARADGFRARYEPDYMANETRTVTAEGVSYGRSQTFGQMYRLSLDRSFSSSLRLSAGGLFDWDQGTSYHNDLRSESDDRQASFYGTLTFGNTALGGNAGYNRNSDVSLDLFGRRKVLTENLSTNLSWRPEGFPSLVLQASRFQLHEGGVHRTTVDQANLASRYEASQHLDLSYSLRVGHPVDHLSGSETVTVSNAAQVSYNRRILDGRTTVMLTYDASHRQARLISAGTGDFEEQQFPVAGLSLVEEFPAIPEQSTLVPNPGVIDGRTGTSANLNLGTRASASGDPRNRHVGVQFPDVATRVNTLYLYLDRPLPLDVAATLTFTVWQSEDNFRWTEIRPQARPGPGGIGVREAVGYDPVLSRYAIRIPTTSAKYLKVVVKPLSLAATTDEALADVFVTELQTILEVPAASVESVTSSFANRVTGAAKTRLLRSHDLFHDVAADVTYRNDRGGQATYSLENGLSYREQLNRVFAVTARIARLDYDQAAGHEGMFIYTSSLSASPLPTLTHILSYSGSWIQARDRETVRNGVSLSNRIELYDGISLAALGSYSVDVSDPGLTTRAALASTSATIVPHRTTSLTGSYAYTWTKQSGAGAFAVAQDTQRVEGNVTFAPFKALHLFGGAAQVRARGEPQTLANLGVAFSPFSGGDLQLRFAYVETLDTAAEGKTRILSPSLRWNIRRGAHLDVTLSRLESDAAAADVSSRSLTASLAIPVW